MGIRLREKCREGKYPGDDVSGGGNMQLEIDNCLDINLIQSYAG